MTKNSEEIEREALQLLEDAFEQPSADRIAFIRQQTNYSPVVRERSVELLLADRSSKVDLKTGGAPFSSETDMPLPDEIGEFRVLDRLGKGGMGAVYLAEPLDKDFEHKVAIKVIKPGGLSDTLVERVRRERQILAQLNHPNIAHLHGGGETDQGLPFIVMEYLRAARRALAISGGSPAGG